MKSDSRIRPFGELVGLGEGDQGARIAYATSHVEISPGSLFVVSSCRTIMIPRLPKMLDELAQGKPADFRGLAQPHAAAIVETGREGRAHACFGIGQRLVQMYQQGVRFVTFQDQNRPPPLPAATRAMGLSPAPGHSWYEDTQAVTGGVEQALQIVSRLISRIIGILLLRGSCKTPVAAGILEVRG